MAQNSYIGVSGKARTIKAINVGVAGKARKVVNGYIGVAGKARPFFSLAKGIKFYQTVDPLNAATHYLAAASIGDYGLFAGGSESTQVTSYNGSLQKGTPTALSTRKLYHSGQGNSGYAMFAGGLTPWDGTVYDTIEGYSSSLQKSSATLQYPRHSLASARTGSYTYALFAGGNLSNNLSNNLPTTAVDSYNTSMQRVNTSALTTAVSDFAGGNVGVYAIFAGGYLSDGGVSTQVTAYNNSLQKSRPTYLSVGRALVAAATIINTTDAKRYILFAGGNDGSSKKTLIEAYSDSLQRTILTTGLETAQAGLVGTSCRGYEGETAVYQAVFAGDLLNTVTIINSSLQRLTPSAISSSPRPGLAATWVPYSTREYALLGGGNNTAVVDAFTYF